MEFFLQLLASGVIAGSIYALMALGVVIIYKASSVFNFAHGSIVALTAYLVWSLLVQFDFSPAIVVPIFLISILLVSLLIHHLILRPLTGQPILAIVIVTLALSEFLAGLITLLWPAPGRTYPPFIPSGILKIGPVAFSYEGITNFFICAVAFILFLLFFRKTKVGLTMRGTAEDHILARSEGVKVTRIFVLAWFISILLAAIGGVLTANVQGVNAEPLMSLGMKALAVVIIGGIESIPGAVLGGLLIGILEALAVGYLDPIVGGGIGETFPFMVLLLALIIMPYGFFGYPRIERV